MTGISAVVESAIGLFSAAGQYSCRSALNKEEEKLRIELWKLYCRMSTRLLSATAVASLLAFSMCPAAAPSGKASPAAKAAVVPLEPGQLSQLALPEGISSLCVVRVQKVMEALEEKGLGALTSGFLEGIDPHNPQPLRSGNLISATVAITDEGALMILFALREPADLTSCEGVRPAQPIGGWKTFTYREDSSSYCQITPVNVLWLQKERRTAARTAKEALLHQQLPRLVRGISECRARTAKLPVAFLAGPSKGSTARGSLKDGLRQMAIELELEPQLMLKGRGDFNSAKRATEVAADLVTAWPFLSRLPGIPDALPETKVEGMHLQATLAFYPAVMAAESLQDSKSMRRARDQRNAQNIVSIFQASVSSGVRSLREVESLAEVIRLLQEGVTVNEPDSPFHGKTFSIGKLKPQDAAGATRYIIFSKEGLDYFQFEDLDNVEPVRQASTYAQLIAQMWHMSLDQRLADGSGLKSPQDAVDRLSGLKGRTESRLGQAYFFLSPEHIRKGLTLLKVEDGELLGEVLPAPELDAYRKLAGVVPLSTENMEAELARLDARNIAVMFTAARASGAAGLDRVRSAEEAVRLICKGTQVNDPSSPFHGKRFTLGHVTSAQIKAALHYLTFEDGELNYSPTSVAR